MSGFVVFSIALSQSTLLTTPMKRVPSHLYSEASTHCNINNKLFSKAPLPNWRGEVFLIIMDQIGVLLVNYVRVPAQPEQLSLKLSQGQIMPGKLSAI